MANKRGQCAQKYSDAERAAMIEMAKHATYSAVAEHFGCSHSTVHRYVQNALSPVHCSVKTALRTPANGTIRSNEPHIKGKAGLAQELSAKSGTDTVPERPASKAIPSGRSAVPESLPLKPIHPLVPLIRQARSPTGI